MMTNSIRESPLHELYEDQLACADLVLLNKTDLMDDDAVEAVATEVGSRLRDRVRMVRTPMAPSIPACC